MGHIGSLDTWGHIGAVYGCCQEVGDDDLGFGHRGLALEIRASDCRGFVSGFGVQGFGFRVGKGLRFGLGVWSLGLRVYGLGVKVQSFRSRAPYALNRWTLAYIKTYRPNPKTYKSPLRGAA